MLPLLDCPGIQSWQALFDGRLPPQQREQCERHLESCASCQALLDHLEEGDYDLRAMGRLVGDRTTVALADPTLAEVVERLLEGPPAPEPSPLTDLSELYFLCPSGRPGALGTLGEYEAHAVLGHGGMGIVFRAFDPALQRLVAIKVMAPVLAGSPTARQRFIREAQAAAAVTHEHIVAIHGVHEANGLPYLVMQYVAGESLQDCLDRSGPLEVIDIVHIGLQTASGLAAAHARGLIHRDVKPAN